MNWDCASRVRFGLTRLSEISGVAVPTIQRWQHRKAIRFRRIGRGKVRSYDIGDALHLAFIAELAAVGVGITGKGAMLSEALTSYAEHHLRQHGSAAELGALALIPDGDDWRMDHEVNCAGRRGSFVVVNIEDVAAGVRSRILQQWPERIAT